MCIHICIQIYTHATSKHTFLVDSRIHIQIHTYTYNIRIHIRIYIYIYTYIERDLTLI